MKSIVGKILYDRYRIVRQLSQNDWSRVYLAEDLANNGKVQYDIEQLQPQYEREILGSQSWQIALQTFISQGNLLQKASNHPQIPQLLAFFECDREFYLVRESVRGITLNQKLENTLLSESEAINWLKEMLGILEFTHKSGVAHLNIQPASLVLLNNGTKSLTNFAAMKSAVIADRQELIGVLNPDFSPSDRDRSDFSSDIYALGKTIIYALTGKIANSIQSKSLDRVKSQQLTNLNNSPSADIRPELARVLNKMVASSEDRPYQSVIEVLNELDFQDNVVTFPSPFAGDFNPHQSPSKAIANKPRSSTRSSRKSLQKIIWFLLSLPFIVATVIIFIGLNKNSQRDFAEYINNEYQFSLKYPQDWSEQQIDDPITGEVVVFNSPLETGADLFREKVYVAIEYLASEPTDLAEYSQTVLERINETEGNNTELYKDFRSTIDNAPARTVVYSRQEGRLQLRQMESFTIRNDRVYIAIYTAEEAQFSKFYPTVEKMIDSWEIQ